MIDEVVTIRKAVAEFYQITIDQMDSKCREYPLIDARQQAMRLIKAHTNLSLKRVGNLFAGRDHTTVLHAVKRVDDLCFVEPYYRKTFERLKIQVDMALKISE